jgi:hypothetical protein
MGKSSAVHEYFDVIEGGFKCKIAGCTKPIVKCSSSSTSGEWSHIEQNHSEIFEELKVKKQPAKRKLQTIEEQLELRLVPVKKSKTEEAEYEAVKMIARRKIPFTIVDDSFFQSLLTANYKGIKLHGSRHYARTVLPRVANESLKVLRKEMPVDFSRF